MSVGVGPGEAFGTLLCASAFVLLFALPFVVIGALTQRRRGGNVHRRAALSGLTGGLLTGLGLGMGGFFFGASIGDIQAGEAAIALGAMGLAIGLPVYGAIHFGVWLFGRGRG